MTATFWKSRDAAYGQEAPGQKTEGPKRDWRLKLLDYAIVWVMIALTVAGVVPRLVASWSALISAS